MYVFQLTVFKQFFLSLNLPYAIIRGEEFGLQVTVYNYLSSDQQVCSASILTTNPLVLCMDSPILGVYGIGQACSMFIAVLYVVALHSAVWQKTSQ